MSNEPGKKRSTEYDAICHHINTAVNDIETKSKAYKLANAAASEAMNRTIVMVSVAKNAQRNANDARRVAKQMALEAVEGVKHANVAAMNAEARGDLAETQADMAEIATCSSFSTFNEALKAVDGAEKNAKLAMIPIAIENAKQHKENSQTLEWNWLEALKEKSFMEHAGGLAALNVFQSLNAASIAQGEADEEMLKALATMNEVKDKVEASVEARRAEFNAVMDLNKITADYFSQGPAATKKQKKTSST